MEYTPERLARYRKLGICPACKKTIKITDNSCQNCGLHLKPQEQEKGRLLTLKDFDAIADGIEEQEPRLEPEPKKKYKRPNKQKFVKVFVDDENKTLLQAKAGECSMSLSKYLKTAGLNKHIKRQLPTQVVKDINGFGRNLNQLSFHANSGKFDTNEMKELKQQADQIIKLLRREK